MGMFRLETRRTWANASTREAGEVRRVRKVSLEMANVDIFDGCEGDFGRW